MAISCNLDGPTLGCLEALHTYSCQFRVIREVQGLFSPSYFAAEEDQLFYELFYANVMRRTSLRT